MRACRRLLPRQSGVERSVHPREPAVREADERAAPVVRVRRAGDQRGPLQPVEAGRGPAAAEHRRRRQRLGRELVRGPRPAQRREDVELRPADVGAAVDLLGGVAGQPGDAEGPPEDRHGGRVEVRSLPGPLFDDPVHSVAREEAIISSSSILTRRFSRRIFLGVEILEIEVSSWFASHCAWSRRSRAAVWGRTSIATTEALPPGRPLLASALRACLPVCSRQSWSSPPHP